MKLLEYLEPMKTLPNRFSNLAFWRVLRAFKDDVVAAFTYVNTWGLWVEDEEAKQNDRLNSNENAISTIQAEQTTQNDSIAANTSEISDIRKSIDSLNPDVDALKKLTYDASLNFKITTYNDTKATVTNLVDSLYIITPDASGYIFPSVPFHVVGRAFISIFTNKAHTKTSTIAIPLTHVITMSNGKTKYLGSTTPFYAPYGVNNMSGCYITYFSHT
jgi:soluble cytochrome b562